MNRSRPLVYSINEIRFRMSTKARIPTYYETLKVDRDCTQDDIKSAYYELSKKYHPDRNKSLDAKHMFQNVSDAYEVLGNFSKRKQYDRNLSARGERATTIHRPEYDVREDPLAAFYRSRMSNNDHVRAHESKANFDFETWTQAHYGQTLRRRLKDKRNKLLREEMQRLSRLEAEQDRASALFIFFMSSIVICGLIIQSVMESNEYDRNLIARQANKDKKP